MLMLNIINIVNYIIIRVLKYQYKSSVEPGVYEYLRLIIIIGFKVLIFKVNISVIKYYLKCVKL